MKVFLSYASDDKERVAEVNYALNAEGHDVFFDRDDLPTGAAYHARIRSEIEACDLFVFFLAPAALEPGRYTLTELKHARERWQNPEGRVLPVVLAPTPGATAYLKAVTWLKPEGNLAAEVAAAVAEVAERRPAEPEAARAKAPEPAIPRPRLQVPSYTALRISFGKGRASAYPADVAAPPGASGRLSALFGRLRAVFARPLRIDPHRLEALLWAPGVGAAVPARQAGETALPTAKGAREVGEQLYSALFGSHLGPTLEARMRSLDQQRGVGVRFEINTTQARELARLPWEFTYNKHDNLFIFSDRLTPLVRWLDLERPLPTLAVEPPLRLLVAVAAPTDRPELSVGAEIAALAEALGDLADDGVLEPIRLDHASIETLEDALMLHQPHVLHFIGHGDFQGDEGVLILEQKDRSGESAPITGTQLASLLSNHLASLRLVFLNSCLSAAASNANPFSSVADSLMRRGLPAVVAMQFPIPDAAAVALGRRFYSYLATGLPVDAALTAARAYLFADADYGVAWGAPALSMRTPDAQLFAIPGVPAAGSPVPPPALWRWRRPTLLVLLFLLVAGVLGIVGWFGFQASGRRNPQSGGAQSTPPDPGEATQQLQSELDRQMRVAQELARGHEYEEALGAIQKALHLARALKSEVRYAEALTRLHELTRLVEASRNAQASPPSSGYPPSSSGGGEEGEGGGGGEPRVAVPTIVGESVDGALRQLAALGLALDAPPDARAHDIVIEQHPAADRSLPAGGVVRVRTQPESGAPVVEPPPPTPPSTAPTTGAAIHFAAVTCFVAGEFPLLDAAIEPFTGVARVRTYFRSAQRSSFYYVEMTQEGGRISGKLPRLRVEASPITYYLQATTTEFQEIRTPDIEAIVVENREDCGDRKLAALGPPGEVTVFPTAAGAAPGSAGVAAGAGVEPLAHWALRGFAAWTDPTGADFPGAIGGGLGVEYRLSHRLGVELNLLLARLDVDAAKEGAKLDTRLLTLGLSVHLTPGRRADLYAGPLIGRVDYGSLSLTAGGVKHDSRFDPDLAWGAHVGVDVNLTRSGTWAFTTDLGYLKTSADSQRGDLRLKINPVIGTAGVAIRF